METLVTRVLSKYFKQFIKDFSPDQFSITLSKGKAQLTDIELNAWFIQAALMIPPNLAITSCTCNDLTVTLPNVTKLSEKPITILLDKVALSLEEPENLRPLHSVIPKPEKEKKGSRGSEGSSKPKKKKKIQKIVENMRFVINEAHFKISLLPRQDTKAENWSPSLEMHLYDIVIQTTNGNWEVVDLNQAPSKSLESKIESTFKVASCRSLALDLVSEDNSSRLPIVANLPIEVRITTNTSLETGKVVLVDLSFVIPLIKLEFSTLSWGLIVKLFSSLRQCLARKLPEEFREKVESSLKERKQLVDSTLVSLDVRYNISIENWAMIFTKDEANKDGYAFEGKNVQFKISPKRRVPEENLYESNVLLTAESLTFGEISPNPLIDPFVSKVISQLPRANDSGNFISVLLNHRWTESSAPKSTTLDVQLSGGKVVLDREVFKGFHKFWSDSVVQVLKGDLARSRKEKAAHVSEAKETEKKIEEFVSLIKPKTMSEYFYWLHNSKVNVDVTNTIVILPRDYYVRKDGVQLNFELRARAKKLSISNVVGWQVVPYLKDMLLHVPSDFVITSVDATLVSNRVQFDISDVAIDMIDENNESSALLQPTSTRIYARFLEKSDQKLQPKMELALHSNTFQFTMTEKQEAYFKQMGPLYNRWGHKLVKQFKALKSEKDVVQSLEEGKQAAILVATKFAENTFASDIMEKAKVDTFLAVEEAFKLFQCVVVFKAERGVINIPIHTSEKLEENLPSTLSSFAFNGLDFVFEISLHHQIAQFQLGKFEAKNLDHPKSPSSLSLLPVSVASDYLEEMFRHVIISCNRHRPTDGSKPYTDLLLRLQGLQLVSQMKPGAIKGIHQSIESALPDMQKILQKITKTLSAVTKSRKKQNLPNQEEIKDDAVDKFQEGIAIAEKTLDFLGLHWSLQVADCEFGLYEAAEKLNSKPFGSVKIASFTRDAVTAQFKTLNDQLIQTKMKLAESVCFLGEAEFSKKDLQDEANKLEKIVQDEAAKAKAELEELEKQLIETKLSLVLAQSEIEDLKQQIRKR